MHCLRRNITENVEMSVIKKLYSEDTGGLVVNSPGWVEMGFDEKILKCLSQNGYALLETSQTP